MIQYVNKVPSKIEYYDMMRTVYQDIEITELTMELESTITAVCAYKGDRIVGIGRVKQEGNVLCIEDLVVKLDAYREEIQNNIIVNLIEQVNRMKLYNVTVRDCLDMSVNHVAQNFDYNRAYPEGQIEVNESMLYSTIN